MTDHKFTIISGYFHRPNDAAWADWFFTLWITKNWPAIEQSQAVYLIGNGGCTPFRPRGDAPLELVDRLYEFGEFYNVGLKGDLGHVHNLLPGKAAIQKPYAYCGWTATALAGAMLCYANETDMVFVEQDCLMFGDCVGEMYRQLGARKMIFGKTAGMPCAQSLFLIKHDFLPDFVREYLSMPNDRCITALGEQKFMRMMESDPARVCQFDFPFDRTRPLDMTLPVWYAQKWRPDELLEAERRGLLTLPPNMPDVKVFTNDTTGL